MKQPGLIDARLMKRTRRTRKEVFLEEKNAVIPWQVLLVRIEPYYPKPGRGRLPEDTEKMLRYRTTSTDE